MARRYRSDNRVAEGIAGLIVLFALYMLGLWQTNRVSFWLYVSWGAILFSVVGIIFILWSDYKDKRRKNLIASVQEARAEEDVINFINSFGHANKADKKLWNYQGYYFTWNQLDSLRRALHDKGVKLSITDKYMDISYLLRYYIYYKDDKFVRETIAHQNHTFSAISDSQFEDLLRRLYEAQGYSVMRTGKTGDMGCDLVVNMPDQRAVVQAKHWKGTVGVEAVQQANGALGPYNCTKAYVVTASTFTPEAIQVAKLDNVGLVDGHRLRELLLQYLKENWS